MAKLRSEQARAAFQVRNVLRQKCRTNLLFLCKILGYNDVSRKVHGPILDILQKFPGGEDIEVRSHAWKYKPFKPLQELEGPINSLGERSREILALYPRGHLKTTLISQAHLIQWIINYPEVRIALSTAVGEQLEKVVRAIKGVFQYNEDFRKLFPELCPADDKVSDWGTITKFTVPIVKAARSGEPTLNAITVGKTISGYHPDVIFHSDVVDKENVKTPGGLGAVIEHFKYMLPLTERYSATEIHPASRGWTYVEGTPYDFGDLHNLLMKNPEWAMVIKPAQENYPEGEILWPERFTQPELDRLRREMGDWLFSAQYLMKCVPEGDGLCGPEDVVFIPHEHIRNILPQLRLQCTIDLHGMEVTKRGDDTVMTVSGFDRDGRALVPEIQCGQFGPEEVIEKMFSIKRRYPQLLCFKIEKDAHARVLLPFLRREQEKRHVYLTVVPIQRDTSTSKKQRIRGLRPWFRDHIIRFSDNIPVVIKTKLIDQVVQFPSESSGVHDDILDTLADAMQDGEGGVTADVVPASGQDIFAQFGRPKPPDRFLGFDEFGVSQWLYGQIPETRKQDHRITGVL